MKKDIGILKNLFIFSLAISLLMVPIFMSSNGKKEYDFTNPIHVKSYTQDFYTLSYEQAEEEITNIFNLLGTLNDFIKSAWQTVLSVIPSELEDWENEQGETCEVLKDTSIIRCYRSDGSYYDEIIPIMW